MSAVGLLGSWVVFVFRNVSVESATRPNDGKHIGEIVCFLRFKEKKIITCFWVGESYCTLLGSKIHLNTWSQDLVFHRSNIILERVKLWCFFFRIVAEPQRKEIGYYALRYGKEWLESRQVMSTCCCSLLLALEFRKINRCHVLVGHKMAGFQHVPAGGGHPLPIRVNGW